MDNLPTEKNQSAEIFQLLNERHENPETGSFTQVKYSDFKQTWLNSIQEVSQLISLSAETPVSILRILTEVTLSPPTLNILSRMKKPIFINTDSTDGSNAVLKPILHKFKQAYPLGITGRINLGGKSLSLFMEYDLVPVVQSALKSTKAQLERYPNEILSITITTEKPRKHYSFKYHHYDIRGKTHQTMLNYGASQIDIKSSPLPFMVYYQDYLEDYRMIISNLLYEIPNKPTSI